MSGKRWQVTGAQKGALKSVVAVGWNGMDELTRLRRALQSIADSAPTSEPSFDDHKRNETIAWAYWVAGEKARKLLQESPPQGS